MVLLGMGVTFPSDIHCGILCGICCSILRGILSDMLTSVLSGVCFGHLSAKTLVYVNWHVVGHSFWQSK